jgi:hypothetical protein
VENSSNVEGKKTTDASQQHSSLLSRVRLQRRIKSQLIRDGATFLTIIKSQLTRDQQGKTLIAPAQAFGFLQASTSLRQKSANIMCYGWPTN